MLSNYLNSRQNNLGLIRLLAAIAVVYGHCYPLANTAIKAAHTPDPILAPLLPYLGFGKAMSGLAVLIFFFISGFLIAKSYGSQTWRGFWLARILRIYPAFLWINLLFCVMLGFMVSGIAFMDFFTHPQTKEYIWLNATLLRTAFVLPNVFADLPWNGINGSLWTLPLELRMYIFCFFVGVSGALARPKYFNFAFALIIAYFCGRGRLPFLNDLSSSSLPLNFMLGMFAYVNSKYICLNYKWLGLLLFICIISYNSLPRHCYDLSFSLVLGYVLLLLSYKKYWRRLDLSRYGDFSYAIYLYGYPIQQLIIYLHNGVINPLLLFVYAMVALAPIAAFSWFVVEKPALRFAKKISKKIKN